MKIKFIRDFFVSKDGENNEVLFQKDLELTIDMNDINLLVGENGAGKTTIIEFLSKGKFRNSKNEKYFILEDIEEKKSVSLTAEAFRKVVDMVDNRSDLRKKQLNNYSHGQAWNIVFDHLENLIISNNGDLFIFIDEPETALSTNSILNFCERIRRLKSKYPKLGMLVATHSLIILELIGDNIIQVPSLSMIDKYEYINDINKKIEYIKNNVKKRENNAN